MRSGEGVVDVNVTDFRHRRDQRWVIFLLAGVEAGVFQHGDVAGGEHGQTGLGPLPCAVGDEHHAAPQRIGNRVDDQTERHCRVLSALGPSEMRQ